MTRIRVKAEIVNLLVASGVWHRLSHRSHMRIWRWYTGRPTP